MDSRIPKPGIPNYLKQLSDTLARLMSSNAPFDENIFTWILYCLAVGDKHLILRTSPKDLVSVQKTAKSVRISIQNKAMTGLSLTSVYPGSPDSV
jgi:hypothetical protein